MVTKRQKEGAGYVGTTPRCIIRDHISARQAYTERVKDFLQRVLHEELDPVLGWTRVKGGMVMPITTSERAVDLPCQDPGLSKNKYDHTGRFISVYGGHRFYIDVCNIDEIPMESIAHALSMNCRFNGHLARFYSVAEHSVILSRLVSPQNAKWALLHDISEAFIPDMPRPFKDQITGFERYEGKIMEAVVKHYGLAPIMPDDVAYQDKHIVGAEATVLFDLVPDWVEAYEVNPEAVKLIVGRTPMDAKQMFMERFYELQSI